MVRKLALPLLLAAVALAAGCGGGSESDLRDPGDLGAIDYIPVPGQESDDVAEVPDDVTAVLVRFVIGSSNVRVLVTDREAMAQLLAIQAGRGASARLLARPGRPRGAPVAGHRLPISNVAVPPLPRRRRFQFPQSHREAR